MRRPFHRSSQHAIVTLTRPTRRRGVRRGFRPEVERLEDWTLLSTVAWTNPSGGDWDSPCNWSNGAMPTASDDVVINMSGITVTHSGSAADAVNSLTISASDATLDLSNGSLAMSATSSIAGNLTMSGGTLSTASTLTVTGAMSWTGGTISGGGTLAAQGGIAISGNGPTLDNSTLDNSGMATWSGGTIIANHGAVFNNEPGASFDAQSDANFGWGGTGAVPTFNNLAGANNLPCATFIKSGGTGSSGTQMGVVFNNAGAVAVNSGTLSLGASTVTQTAGSSGSFEGAAGTTLEFLTSQDFTPTSSINADTVEFSSGDNTSNEAGAYSASTATLIEGSANVNFTGTVNSLGSSLDIYGVANFSPTVPTSTPLTTDECTIENSYLAGTDNLVVTGMLTLVGGILDTTGTTDAEGGITIEAFAPSSIGAILEYGTLDNYGTATWTGGTIIANNGAVFNNEPGASFNAQFDDSFLWSGFVSAGAGAVPTFNNLAGATFVKSGGTGSSGTQMGVVFNNAGAVNLQSGTLQLGGSFPGGQSVTNSGTVTIEPGTILAALSDYDQTAGITTLNGGTFSGGNLDLQGGALVGSGTTNANVTNAGQVIPGGTGAAGLLTINGTYTQTATGALNVDLGGTTAGSQYDQLAVSGSATLGGTLNVATIGSFTPALGNRFQVLTFGSSSGSFATYHEPSLVSGLFLDPVFSSTSLTLDTDQVTISGAPAFPLEGNPISLTGSVTGPSAGNPFTFSWTVTQNGNPFSSGTGSPFTFAPNASGTYLVGLTVSDAAGGTGTATLQIVVVPSIFVLNPTASGSLTLSGNASINIPGEIVVDSSSSSALSASGNAQLAASLIGVTGGVQKSGNAAFNPAPTMGVAPLADPLAGLTGPSTSSLTSYGAENLSGSSQATIQPGIYSQITVSGKASLTLSRGIYVIEGGGLTVTGNARISGSGVMIYNAGSNYPSAGGNFGGITLSGNGTFNLTAPTTGTYAGILIFQSRQSTRALSFSGNAMAGMSGTIYAANALLSMSGNASLQNPLDVGMLNLSGNVTLTQMAAGTDGSGDTSGIANTLLAGSLSVYVNDPSGLFTSDELARIQDAINAWDAILAPYSVTITEVSDPAQANLTIDTGSTSACGSAANGVLGCYNAPNAEITMLQGWNWYAGSDPSQIGANQYDFETTVLHELGHALGLGGSTNPNSPMYEVLAAGVADRTPTTQDLNIPDPPAGADPQMAAGFVPGSAGLPAAPNARAAAPVAVGIPGSAGFMPLPSPSGQWPAVSGQGPTAGVPASLPVGPEPALVIEGPDRDHGRELSLTRPDEGRVFDSVLADLVAGADRSRGDEADGTSGGRGMPEAGGVEDGPAPERIPPDRIPPAGFARPVEFPIRIRPVERGPIGRDAISDSVLDELAAAAVGATGRRAVPADPIARSETPQEPGKGLAQWAATLIVAGSWSRRARFRGVSSRQAGRPRDREESA
jgi:hypothetical protein